MLVCIRAETPILPNFSRSDFDCEENKTSLTLLITFSGDVFEVSEMKTIPK